MTIDNQNEKGIRICPKGHLFEDGEQCPYCSILKDFHPQLRELNLDDIRKHFQGNFNLKNLMTYFITDPRLSDSDEYISAWKEMYLSNNQNFLFSGGWGYSKEDAIIIDMEEDFWGVQFEYKIARLRLNIELFLSRQRGDRFYDIQEVSLMQSLLDDDKKQYDKLEFEHICLYQTDYDELENEFEQYVNNPMGYDYDFLLEHNKKRLSLMYHVKSEFFFDITKMKNHSFIKSGHTMEDIEKFNEIRKQLDDTREKAEKEKAEKRKGKLNLLQTILKFKITRY